MIQSCKLVACVKWASMGFILLLSWACQEKKPGESETAFDRKAMLNNYANQIIIPQWAVLSKKIDSLNEQWAAFEANGTEAQLKACRVAFTSVYVQWQYCQAFNFGPGETGIGIISQELNTYPCRVETVERFVANADTSFQNFSRDTRGLPTLDYLLYYPIDDAATTVARLNQASYKGYTKAVINHLSRLVKKNEREWKTYAAEFSASYATSAGSSLSDLYNEMVKSYEELKNYKIGLVIGRRSGQTTPEVQKAEGYYSGLTALLAHHHLQAIKQLWIGKSVDGTAEFGFKAYLDTKTGGPQLIQETIQGFDAIQTQLDKVQGERIDQSILTKKTSWDSLYDETLKFTRFIKSQMSALLELAITYSSGDGD